MCADHRLAGAEMQMVRVAQDDLGAGAAHVVGAETADHRVGADRHERRRLHLPWGSVSVPARAGAVRWPRAEFEHHAAGQRPAADAARIRSIWRR